MPRVGERAAAIIVDSKFVRQEVMANLGVAPERVHAIHLGVSREFRPRGEPETCAALQALDLAHGGYVLSVGTIEPRKNVGHVLAAYARLPEPLRERYPLVVAGARGWRAADLESELHALAAAGRIRFLGNVPDADLPVLYSGAAAFVFASKYEGFGLPPLEAMASGVPVLVSERASLPEVVGDAALLIDPEHPEATARRLVALLEDSDARSLLARRGIERAARFTWEACARATLEVYRSVR
jgi:glycosyltransferase involved in cell wall biosynthesis